MLDISTELKELYKPNNVPKFYDIYLPSLNLHINSPGTNDKLIHGSFELKESLCSDRDLRFGSCEASEVKFIAADIFHDIKGKDMSIDQGIGGYTVPFGKYKIDSCKKQDDLRYKEIIAYDKLAGIDINVADWYNGLFPTGNETYTLKQFRSSLLAHLGIEEVDQTLPNDNMIVTKTIEPSQISGRTVLEATVELNGAFGHINRQGKFVRIVLQPSYGLYPSETLYPSEDLYPVAETDTSYTQEDIVADTVSKAMYQSVRFEEYTVKEIDKLQIRAEENDIGAIVGTGTNAYVIEGNFLVFGKSAAELEQIAINAFGNMAKRPYRPYEAQSIGLPYIEVGDALQFATDDSVVGYVLQRTLTGIQALKDEFEAPGSEEREQNFGVNKEIIQLQGKATRIQKDVDGVRVEVEDLEQDTASKFEQTATQIFTEVSRATEAEGELDSKITQTAESITQEVTRATEAEGTLSGSIETLAGQVVLKVDADGNIAVVDLNADPSEGSKVTIKADNISLEGLITANGNFKVLPDGSIEAVNGKFSGSVYVELDSVTSAIYGVKGTSVYNVTSYKTVTNPYTYETYEFVVLGDNSIHTLIEGQSCIMRAYDNAAVQGSTVSLGYSTGGGVYNSVRLSNGSFSPSASLDLGTTSNGWRKAYFDELYIDNKPFGESVSALYTRASNNLVYSISLDAPTTTRMELLPSTNISSYSFNLGNSSYPWSDLYIKSIYHRSGGQIGFFGKTPVSRKTVSKLLSSADQPAIIGKINDLLDALGQSSTGYGFINY